MEKFMSIFLQKEQMGVFDENMSSILNEAYEKSLKTHHGIFTQILFNVSIFSFLFFFFFANRNTRKKNEILTFIETLYF